MRYAFLLVMLLLGSCSQAVTLIIENRSDGQIGVSADDRTSLIEAHRAQEIDWPRSDHILTITVEGCRRTFNLDEFQDFLNDWRDADGGLTRRYAVVRGGGFQILRPDADHAAYRDEANRPTWRTKNLTPLSEQCSGTRAAAS